MQTQTKEGYSDNKKFTSVDDGESFDNFDDKAGRQENLKAGRENFNYDGNESHEMKAFIASSSRSLGQHKYWVFLLLTAWVNALTNGVLVAVQSYSCLPYGVQVYKSCIDIQW
jgi:hypothetical protein